MRMAREVDALAVRTPGKKSLAIQAFAKALRSIPTIISDNAGLDASEIIANLRAAHSESHGDKGPAPGVDVNVGEVGDMKEMGIYESFRVKNQVASFWFPDGDWVFAGASVGYRGGGDDFEGG